MNREGKRAACSGPPDVFIVSFFFLPSLDDRGSRQQHLEHLKLLFKRVKMVKPTHSLSLSAAATHFLFLLSGWRWQKSNLIFLHLACFNHEERNTGSGLSDTFVRHLWVPPGREKKGILGRPGREGRGGINKVSVMFPLGARFCSFRRPLRTTVLYLR